MVKQINGQSIYTEPFRLGDTGFHETKASIINRLSNGKSKSISKLDILKQKGLSGGGFSGGNFVGGNLMGLDLQDRAVLSEDAMRIHRKVIPFNGINSPFLNFSSGNSSKFEKNQLQKSAKQGADIIKVNTAFNRY